FRSDLYFRLHVMEIRLPPLRDRGDDITQLAERLLERTCKRLNRPPMRFSDEALQSLQQYPWPGNVREMENTIERSVILADGDTINSAMLGLKAGAAAQPDHPQAASLSLDDYFVQFVRDNEQMTETELARQLGISRKTLWERRQRLGIPRKR
ncbi:MAG TPA: sigma-54-dependent Fis family transcriptional regulator, partial [Gammaproteobacteria bacterium]